MIGDGAPAAVKQEKLIAFHQLETALSEAIDALIGATHSHAVEGGLGKDLWLIQNGSDTTLIDLYAEFRDREAKIEAASSVPSVKNEVAIAIGEIQAIAALGLQGTTASASGTSLPVGTIIQYPTLVSPASFLLCNGATLPPDAVYDRLRNLIGPNLPDLSNMFIRGATNQAQIGAFTKHSDTTRRPRTADFAGTALNNGSHGHAMNWSNGTTVYANTGNARASTNGDNNWTNRVDGTTGNNITANGGTHNHNVTINSGGDNETAPVHVYLAFHIKY